MAEKIDANTWHVFDALRRMALELRDHRFVGGDEELVLIEAAKLLHHLKPLDP